MSGPLGVCSKYGYRCVSWRRCAPGHSFSIAQRRCRPKVASCPFGDRSRREHTRA